MARGRCAVLLCSILLLAAAWASADVPYVVGSGWTYFGTADYQPGPYGGIGGTFDPPNNEPFTFTLLVPGFLKVTDAFLAGDYIRVYDNGMDISSTPVVPVDPSIWESDPDVVWPDPRWSHKKYDLAPGSHSLQFQNLLFEIGPYPPYYSPAGHFFRVDPVPEAGTLALLLGGCVPALAVLRRRRA
ncbi:MAG: PEP-CTERM sorting domain-containing protein [Armatimonadota bacterium]